MSDKERLSANFLTRNKSRVSQLAAFVSYATFVPFHADVHFQRQNKSCDQN